MEYLAKRATTLLHPPGSIDDVPANRKFQLLNLYLALAVYLASVGELAPALRLIQRALDHVNQSTNVDTIAQLFQGRTAQILFRLTVEHGLPWPESVPPLAFMKRMLASFNDLQKISSEHTFTLSLATVEMTIEVLQHLIVRYDTGPLIEPHVEQLLKFVMRRGAGLRVMQLLLLYGQMCADMQKLDRCEVRIMNRHRVIVEPSNTQHILSFEGHTGLPRPFADVASDSIRGKQGKGHVDGPCNTGRRWWTPQSHQQRATRHAKRRSGFGGRGARSGPQK